MRKIHIILIVSLLFLSTSELSAEKKVKKNAKKKQTTATTSEKAKDSPAIYNDIVGTTPEKDAFSEDWEAGAKTQTALSGDFAEMGTEIRGIIKNHNFVMSGVPCSLQGLPIIYTSKSTGFNLGARLSFADLRYEDPYFYRLAFQLWFSDRGARNHEINLDMPHFITKRWHLRMAYKYVAVIDNNYFGIGNDAVFNKDFVRPSSSNYIARTYYQYILTYPSFTFNIEYNIFKKLFSIYTGIALEKAVIDPRDFDSTSKIFTEKPYGYNGGKTNYIRAGLKFDSRDYEYNPSKGIVLEATYTDHARFIDSDYQYRNADLNYMGFYSFIRYFTIGHRVMLDQMWGDLPFFALAEFRSYERYQGLGGEDILRGAPTFRFIDNLKLIHQIELRTRFYNGQILGQHLQFSIAPFWDIGRVWDRRGKIDFKNFHNSFGSEFRFTWNMNFIASFSFGVSHEAMSTYLSFGETFD